MNNKIVYLPLSTPWTVLSLYAIKGVARMSLNQKSFPFSVFRFPFFANFAKVKVPMANG